MSYKFVLILVVALFSLSPAQFDNFLNNFQLKSFKEDNIKKPFAGINKIGDKNPMGSTVPQVLAFGDSKIQLDFSGKKLHNDLATNSIAPFNNLAFSEKSVSQKSAELPSILELNSKINFQLSESQKIIK